MTFVQIGANDGILFDNLYYFVTEHRCRGLVVEPLEDYYERLALNYRDYPEVIPVRTAVHPTMSTCTLYRVDPAKLRELPGWSAGIASLNPRHHARSGMPADAMIAETVPAIPLMELLDSHRITALDLLQIDTEGFDGEVIRMIDFERITPAIIKFEQVNLSLEDRSGVAKLLCSRGYRLIEDGNDVVAVHAAR